MLDEALLKGFASISLEEMEQVRLMNRIDTKYVTHISKVERLLALATGHYLIQEIDGQRNMPYATCYFDTDDADMFYQHQRGKKTRQKIRRRVYEGSSTTPFLEIKSKSNKGRTSKKRVAMEEGTRIDDYAEFLETHSCYSHSGLRPKMENHFYRITLVNKAMTERVTIDTALEFHNLGTGRRVSLPAIGIIECKRDGLADVSPMKSLLRELRIHEGGFSKYCIGMCVTDPALHHNRMKVKIRAVSKINSSNEPE